MEGERKKVEKTTVTMRRLEHKKKDLSESTVEATEWLRSLSLLPSDANLLVPDDSHFLQMILKKEQESLSDGVVLSKLMNMLQPGIMPSASNTEIVFKKIDNLQKFTEAAIKYGLSGTFSPGNELSEIPILLLIVYKEDLLKQSNPAMVVNTLCKLKSLVCDFLLVLL